MPTNEDLLKWALTDFKDSRRTSRLKLFKDYYNGDHRMAFASDKFRTIFGRTFSTLSLNLCASVIDIQVERMEVVGFTTDKATIEKVPIGDPPEAPPADPATGIAPPTPKQKVYFKVSDPLAEAAWNLWERNAMDVGSDDVHEDSLRYGDGYVIVWPDEDDEIAIWPQEAEQMCCYYSEDKPGKISHAAKLWQDEKRWRLNIYTETSLVQYQSIREVESFGAETLEPDKFEETGTIEHNYGRVPVFHFPNKRSRKNGASELQDVVPIQDALNKTACDMLVAQEFQAYRQRWVVGWEPELDQEQLEVPGLNGVQVEAMGRPAREQGITGAERILTFADGDVKLGEFQQGDLSQFTTVQDKFQALISRVSGIPTHYFFVSSSEAPSGEALKTGEMRLTKKLKNKSKRFGKIWEEVISFALGLEGKDTGEVDFNIVWTNDSPRSETEMMTVQLQKQALKVPQSQLYKEMGYDDAQVMQFLEEEAENAVAAAEASGNDPAAVRTRALMDKSVPSQYRSRKDDYGDRSNA